MRAVDRTTSSLSFGSCPDCGSFHINFVCRSLLFVAPRLVDMGRNARKHRGVSLKRRRSSHQRHWCRLRNQSSRVCRKMRLVTTTGCFLFVSSGNLDWSTLSGMLIGMGKSPSRREALRKIVLELGKFERLGLRDTLSLSDMANTMKPTRSVLSENWDTFLFASNWSLLRKMKSVC